MDISDRLSLLLGMIRCCYQVYYWRYNAQMEPVFTDSPELFQLPEFADLLSIREIVTQRVISGSRQAFFVDSQMGILWLVGLEYEGMSLTAIHVIGPAFSASDAAIMLRNRLNQLAIPVSLLQSLINILDSTPVIPSSVLRQHGAMLQYALTDVQTSPLDIVFVSSIENEQPLQSLEHISNEHRGVWASEQRLTAMVREGNLNYRKALEKAMSLSTGIKMKEGTSLRQTKNSLFVLLTIISRAAIQGGLASSVSYSLNDYYADRIEHSRNYAEIQTLTDDMIDDFVQRVHNVRKKEGVSVPILEACEYISSNLEAPVDIRLLADRAGYSEYYFSTRFKKETGKSVNTFINEKRMERARELLTDSDFSISEIQEMLCIGSRSRFFELFKMYTGKSPAEYRNMPR